MRILIAPDKFKGCLGADAVARHLAVGIARMLGERAEIDLCPLSDGGEGFVDALVAATGGSKRVTRVHGPLPDQRVEAEWGVTGSGDAVIEMASAAGLWRVSDSDRDPMHTTTFGVGELLLAAEAAGAPRVLLGIGGSATIDAGLGCCQAVGHTVLRKDGESVHPTEPLFGRDLADVYAIKRGRGSKLDRLPITVACDVTSPLFGPSGAAHVYGPQKGATPEQVEWFDREHRELAGRCNAIAEADTPGAGAAGGLGWALLSFFNATLVPGLRLVSEAVGLRERIARADLVITGEGRWDVSSSAGKTAAGVLAVAREIGKPCVLVAGRIDAPTDGFTAAVETTPRDLPWPEACRLAPDLLARAAPSALRAATAGR